MTLQEIEQAIRQWFPSRTLNGLNGLEIAMEKHEHIGTKSSEYLVRVPQPDGKYLMFVVVNMSWCNQVEVYDCGDNYWYAKYMFCK